MNHFQTDIIAEMVEIATDAGGLLMSLFHKQLNVECKSEADLVTDADRASETRIVGRIRARWPTHGVVSEEGTRIEPESEYCWYIDPLDGTTNFAHGFPFFSISIALEYKGDPVAGVVCSPVLREIYHAEKGRGSYLNGKDIHVSSTEHLTESLVATGFSGRERQHDPNIHFFQHLNVKTHGVRRSGSAALELAFIAAGRLDAFWEFNLSPWDTMAGTLLVKEAGGRVTDFRGGAFQSAGREIMATNGLVHEPLLIEFGKVCDAKGRKAIDLFPSIGMVVNT